MNQPLLQHFDLLATAPGGVARLRELILTLAVQGQLVPQDPTDEPASVLLRKIRAEKDQLIADGKIKRDKPLAPIGSEEQPYELPNSWGWVPLGSVIEIIRGITFPASEKTREPAQGRIACLRTSNVQQSIEWGDLLFVNRSFMAREDQLVKHHDIVMSMANSRELVGKVALVENIPQPEATFGGFLGVLRPIICDPRFAMLVLRTPYARAMLIDSSSQTTNIANVSLGKLRPLPFPLPPQAEQSRIVARVEELMRLCDALEAKGKLDAEQHAQLVRTLLGTLTDCASPAELAANWQRVAEHFDLLLDRPEAVDVLEQTILQLAVRGLLLPQDPSDEPASVLLKKIRAEKDRLIAEGKIKRDKPLAPIADEEKPFKLPQGWAWARFGDVSVNRDAERVPVSSSDREKRDKIYDYYGASGVIDKIDGFLFDKTLLLIGEDGANLLNRSTPIAFLANGKYWVNNHAHVIDATEEGFLDYLVLFINAISLEPYVTGTAQPKMNQAKLNSIPVALPPLEEQTHIITRVEELRQLCTDLRQRLTASRTTQAHLAETLVEAAGTV